MSAIAIKVEGLSKQYRIGSQQARYQTLRESLVSAAQAPFRKLQSVVNGAPLLSQPETIWALDDVSFEIKHGEAVGIIGRNGAGKTTLLKVLSRITRPTRGRVDLYGRVGSLLEVGTGFHPELTGRENISLYGAVLGMSRREIERKFDEIVAFAEIERFLDTPVKHYSSGMYVRLAFAVAAHLEPEILLVDEVLAVGDAQFQKKCLGKMGNVANEGRTVLFVSHNMQAVEKLCNRTIWLERGSLTETGESRQIIARYLAQGIDSQWERIWDVSDPVSEIEQVRLKFARLIPLDSRPVITVETPIRLEFGFMNYRPRVTLNISVVLDSLEGVCILNTGSDPRVFNRGLIQGGFTIPADFMNDGKFRVRLLIVRDTSVSILDMQDVLTFEVLDNHRIGNWYGKWIGAVRPKFVWDIQETNEHS